MAMISSYNKPFYLSLSLYFLIIFCVTATVAFAQPDIVPVVEEGRVNAPDQQKKPYVILISADGYRFDFDKLYHAAYLKTLKAKGVTTPYMLPSFPSLTFPNHYSIATGLYPSHHGLIANDFVDLNRDMTYSSKVKAAYQDSSWYGGTPIWVLAEKQQMLTASFYWVGSEAAIKGVRPTYWYPYNEKISVDERSRIVASWLKLPEDKRPHLITFYLPQVDQAAHAFGPESPETHAAAGFIDYALAKLTKAVESTGLPVDFIFVSDHGLIKVNNEHPMPISALLSPGGDYTVSGGGNLVTIKLRDETKMNEVVEHFKKNAKGYRVYTKYNTPENWHYGAKDDRHKLLGDIFLEAIAPAYFSDKNPKPGQHGYDPHTVPEMRASFAAWGPSFKERLTIKPFENVNIYPLIAHILGLHITEPIDGNLEVLRPTLK